MAELPSIWRVELWHPVAIHFPIALLLVGTILRLLGIGWPSKWSFHFPLMAGRTLLILGTAGAWIAIYTGSEAYYEVVRTLCDPTVADAHNYFAYWTAGLFSAGVLVDGLCWIRQSTKTEKYLLTGSACLLYIIGSSTLIYTSHLGASLVYQQGAGVYEPSPQCTEFEP
jgi:uncharacterized membrane protein